MMLFVMKKLLIATLLAMLFLSCSKEDDSKKSISGEYEIYMFYVDGEKRAITTCFGRTNFSFNDSGEGFQNIYWETENDCDKIVTGLIDWELREDHYIISSSTGLLFGDPYGIKEATVTIDNNILNLNLIQDGFVFDVEFKRTN